MKHLRLLGLTAAVMLAPALLAGCGNRQPAPSETSVQTETAAESGLTGAETEAASAETAAAESSSAPEETREADLHPIGKKGDLWLLPDAEIDFRIGRERYMNTSEYSTDHPVIMRYFGKEKKRANYGLYSLAEERWVAEPIYGFITEEKDGFCLSTDTGVIYTDRQGNIQLEGEAAMSRHEDPYERRDFHSMLSQDDFSVMYPEILAKHDISPGQRSSDDSADGFVFIDAFEGDPKCIGIKSGNTIYYYDYYGVLMCSQKFPVERSENMIGDPYPRRIDRELVSFSTPSRLLLFRNSVLERTFISGSGGSYGLDSHYYTVRKNNYIYFYNYKDELCGQILVDSEENY